MNGPHPSELLSAYLDDEVTAEQRARVDDWLASSEEGRRELEELRSLSKLLTDTLPLLETPPTLADRVRESILDESSGTVPEQSAHDKRSGRANSLRTGIRTPRRQPLGVAAVASLCTTLVVVVTSAVLLGPPRPDHLDDAGNGSGDLTVARNEARSERSRLGELDHHAESIAKAAVPRPDPIAASGRTPIVGDPHAEEAPGAVAMATEEKSIAQPRRYYVDGRGLARGDGLVLPTTTPNELAAGDVLPVVETRGGRVTVVEVTVVDVRRALGEVQLLLRQNDIRELAAEAAEGAPHENGVERKPGNDDEYAVYVSTSPERLLAALAALRNSDQVVSIDGVDQKTSHAELAKLIRTPAVKPALPPVGGEPLAVKERSTTETSPAEDVPDSASPDDETVRDLADSYQLLGAVRRRKRERIATRDKNVDATKAVANAGNRKPQTPAEDAHRVPRDEAAVPPTRVLLLLRARDPADAH